MTTDTEQKFTGQIRDNETGMDYFHARYFTNALGRFNSPDPANAGAKLENPQSWNGYSYVLNNPLALTDPTGMDSISCDLHNMVPGCTPPYPGNDYQGYAAYVNLMMGNNPFADPFEGFRLMSVPTLLGYQEVPNDPTGSSAAFSAGIEDIPVYGPTFVADDGDSTSRHSWNSPPNNPNSNTPASCGMYAAGGCTSEIIPIYPSKSLVCKSRALGMSLLVGAGSVLGVAPPGSDPAGDGVEAARRAADSPTARATAGYYATRLGSALLTKIGAARVGVFVGEELVPYIGEAATVVVGYQAIKEGVSYYTENAGTCQ